MRSRNEELALGVNGAVTARVLLLATPALILAGCFGGSDDSDARPAVEKETYAPVLAASKGTCPLTLPNEITPPGGGSAGMNHGNGKIWMAMWPHNVVIATPDYIEADGSVGMTWPWWRGVKGKLKISGHRLDGKAPPLTPYLPEGYARSGFQPSGIFSHRRLLGGDRSGRRREAHVRHSDPESVAVLAHGRGRLDRRL